MAGSQFFIVIRSGLGEGGQRKELECICIILGLLLLHACPQHRQEVVEWLLFAMMSTDDRYISQSFIQDLLI